MKLPKRSAHQGISPNSSYPTHLVVGLGGDHQWTTFAVSPASDEVYCYRSHLDCLNKTSFTSFGPKEGCCSGKGDRYYRRGDLTHTCFPCSSLPSLSNDQWHGVLGNAYGIRSAATPTETGAGYALDGGVKFDPMAWLYKTVPMPDHYNDYLKNSIERLMGYGNANDRYLVIESRCPGASELTSQFDNYGLTDKTLTKCTSSTGEVVASTPIRGKSWEDLYVWVTRSVP